MYIYKINNRRSHRYLLSVHRDSLHCLFYGLLLGDPLVKSPSTWRDIFPFLSEPLNGRFKNLLLNELQKRKIKERHWCSEETS